MFSITVALTIFLVFHRLRDVVERTVERLLFRGWHDNETRLRRFGKEAAFIGKPAALTAETVTACHRFTGGAETALYVRDGDEFVRSQGSVTGVAARIDGDDPAAVAMRHDRVVLELSDTNSQLAASLALPMFHRAELDGFILLGAKPSGDSYRPDEIEVLGAIAQQIGLDLHALKVAALEERILALEARNGELRELVEQNMRRA